MGGDVDRCGILTDSPRDPCWAGRVLEVLASDGGAVGADTVAVLFDEPHRALEGILSTPSLAASVKEGPLLARFVVSCSASPGFRARCCTVPSLAVALAGVLQAHGQDSDPAVKRDCIRALGCCVSEDGVHPATAATLAPLVAALKPHLPAVLGSIASSPRADYSQEALLVVAAAVAVEAAGPLPEGAVLYVLAEMKRMARRRDSHVDAGELLGAMSALCGVISTRWGCGYAQEVYDVVCALRNAPVECDDMGVLVELNRLMGAVEGSSPSGCQSCYRRRG